MPVWEEPVRGFYTDPGQFVTQSGLELLHTMLDGGLGPPIRGMAIGTSDVFDADGKKVAVATGSAVILPGRPATVTTELTLPDPAGSEDSQAQPGG